MAFNSFFNYPTDATDDDDAFVLLEDLSEEAWSTLLSYTETVCFKAGETVIETLKAHRSLYIVGGGDLEVSIQIKGKVRRVAEIHEGSIIGEQAFFDGQPRSATVRALSDCTLYKLTPETFRTMAAHEPQIGWDLLFDLGRILSLRLRHTSQLLSQ